MDKRIGRELNMSRIYWANWYFDNQEGIIACSDKGLVYLGSPNESYEHFIKWLKRSDISDVSYNENKLSEYKKQLEEYFSGVRRSFSLDCDLIGTEFQMKVWETLSYIPFGETVSYSKIAERLGMPKSIRAVASAIAKNPILIIIPCHRVVRKSGKNTDYRGGLDFKLKLLEIETD